MEPRQVPQVGEAYKPAWTLDHNQSFALRVRQGLVPGHSWVAKFGENPDIDTTTDPEDVWEFGGVYTYDPFGTAPIVSLVSDNAGDTVPIWVQGLDINGDLVAQTITLTGTTRVALTTPLWRVFRMSNEGDADVLGTVYCYTGTGGVPAAPAVRATISNGNNQTLMALYTIPSKTVGFLMHFKIGGSRSTISGEVQAAYFERKRGKVFKVKERVDISTQGNSIYSDFKEANSAIPANTDLRATVESVSANDIGVFCTFDVLLIDERLFDTAFLTSIGQPGY